MINRIDEHIEYHKSIDSHKSDVAFLEAAKRHIMILENQLDLEKEDIWCVHKWLDDKSVPRTLGDNEYSIVGRIQILLSCEEN